MAGTKNGIEPQEAVFNAKLCPDEVVNPASLGFIGSGNIAQALLATFLKDGVCVHFVLINNLFMYLHIVHAVCNSLWLHLINFMTFLFDF